MDDALLASRAAAGDLDSYGQLYDRYFTRVYDFLWRTLSDPADAALATEEAFAATAAALTSPGAAPTFRSLLFAQAHNAALARDDASNAPAAPAHEEAFGAFDAPDPADLENVTTVRGDYELAVLAWEAFASLTARDYALLDLHLRQRLGAQEIAHVLGVSKKDAQSIVSRMMRSASDVIESYVVARRGACPQLRELLAPFAIPPLEEEARIVAQTHVAGCTICGPEKAQLPPMFDVFAAFTPIAAPLALKGDVWRAVASSWRIAPAPVEAALFEDEPYDDVPASPYKPLPEDAGGGIPPYTPRERPYRRGEDDGRNRIVVFAAAAIALLVFAFAGGAVISGAFSGGGGDDGAVSVDPTTDASSPGVSTPEPATSITPGVSVETPTQDPDTTPTVGQTAEPTETPAPAATATTAPPPPATATPVPPSPTPAPVDPNPTPTRRALIPITPTPLP